MLRLVRDLTSFILAVIEVLLVFRFILKLLGASSAASFIAWLYSVTEPFLAPFAAAFPPAPLPGRFVLELSTLFAIFVYAFVGLVVQQVLSLLAGSRK